MHRVVSEVVTRRGTGFRVEKYSTDLDEYLEKLDLTGKAPDAMPMLDALRPKSPARPAAPAGPRPGHGPKGRTSAARINRLAGLVRAERYLEVGVSGGDTFLAVEIATRHAVDPKFRFETRPPMRPSACASSRSPRTPTSPARCRPTSGSTSSSSTGCTPSSRPSATSAPRWRTRTPDTIWIIDDVFPSDVFSALPSQEAAYAFRQQHGSGARVWHGDVYKSVFAIHDFFPNVSFRTFEPGPDNPQTVIVNRPRPDFAPRFNDLETISRLDYYGFWENRALLNLTPEEVVFDWVAACAPELRSRGPGRRPYRACRHLLGEL